MLDGMGGEGGEGREEDQADGSYASSRSGWSMKHTCHRRARNRHEATWYGNTLSVTGVANKARHCDE